MTESEVIENGPLLLSILGVMDGDSLGALSGQSHKIAGEKDIDHIFDEAFLLSMLYVCVCRQYVCSIIIWGASNNKGVSLPGKLWDRSEKIAWKGGGGYG